MGEETPVWADGYGCCDYDGIFGASVEDDRVVLQVINVGDYR